MYTKHYPTPRNIKVNKTDNVFIIKELISPDYEKEIKIISEEIPDTDKPKN